MAKISGTPPLLPSAFLMYCIILFPGSAQLPGGFDSLIASFKTTGWLPLTWMMHCTQELYSSKYVKKSARLFCRIQLLWNTAMKHVVKCPGRSGHPSQVSCFQIMLKHWDSLNPLFADVQVTVKCGSKLLVFNEKACETIGKDLKSRIISRLGMLPQNTQFQVKYQLNGRFLRDHETLEAVNWKI